LYQLGNYHEAVREFGAGYELVPRPQFLLNLGQCYRKLNDLEKAREMYQRYLRDAPATDVERPQAQQILAEIERQLAASKPPASPPPQAAPPAAASSMTVIRPAPPREKRPFIKRHWWIFPASAVVVGVAVGVGVYYGTRTDPCAGANLACWDLSKAQ
jgi:tetratricopeptide (TPR) repeat protein